MIKFFKKIWASIKKGAGVILGLLLSLVVIALVFVVSANDKYKTAFKKDLERFKITETANEPLKVPILGEDKPKGQIASGESTTKDTDTKKTKNSTNILATNYSVEVLDNQASESLESLESTIRMASNLKSIKRVTIGGHPSIEYRSLGNPQYSYAVVKDNKIYYFQSYTQNPNIKF